MSRTRACGLLQRGGAARPLALLLLALGALLLASCGATSATATATATRAHPLAAAKHAHVAARPSSAQEQASLQPHAQPQSQPQPSARAARAARLRRPLPPSSSRSLVESSVTASASASASASLRQLARARQSLASWQRFALSSRTFFGAAKVKGRGAGGRAGRPGPKGNAAQSGRKAGDAAGNGAQSGRKAGDTAGNGAQSGRKAGDTSGTGAQSGRKAGNGSKVVSAPPPPVSPILGNPPPSSANVFVVPIDRLWLDRTKKAPPVEVYLRNQGDGPTCWAHAAVMLYEMALQMVLSGPSDFKGWLSVDQVVKCVKSEPDGGNPLDALQFIMTHHLMFDADVRNGKPIECKKRKWGIAERGHYSPTLAFKPCIKPGEDCSRMSKYEPQMAREFRMSPLLVWVDASQWLDYKPSFTRGRPLDYARVAFDPKRCSMDPQKGDHLVTLLGVDTDPVSKKSYWRAYNSWGADWGVNGLIYLPYGINACGLANYPVGLHGTLIDDGFNTSRPMAMLPTDMRWSAAMKTPEYKAGMIGLSGGILDI